MDAVGENEIEMPMGNRFSTESRRLQRGLQKPQPKSIWLARLLFDESPLDRVMGGCADVGRDDKIPNVQQRAGIPVPDARIKSQIGQRIVDHLRRDA